MQATLDAASLKPLIKALTCLSKYGDDVMINATADVLCISTTNSSMSAYCQFKYSRQFFTRYHVGPPNSRSLPAVDDCDDEPQAVTGQLLAKPLLSTLRHRAMEKTVEKCEIQIIEGEASTENTGENSDGLESGFIVRFHCKHGVIKTHRLNLMYPTSLLAPEPPDTDSESHLTIGPLALQDMIAHFTPARGPRSDPRVVWNFDQSEVQVRNSGSSINFRATAPLSTELTISTDEFERYEVHTLPTAISFHLREFSASVSYAEAMSLALDFHFTEPASPLFINVDADDIETLFVISTTQVHNSEPTTVPNQARQRALANGGNDIAKKRMRDSETPTATPKFKKSVKVVRRTELTNHRQAATTPSSSMGASANGKKKDKQPLFLPSQSDIAVEEGHDVNMTGPDMDGADAYGFEYEDQVVQMGDLNPPSEGEDMIFALSQAKAERPFKPLFDD